MTSFDRPQLAGAQQAREDFLASHTLKSLNVETFEGKKAWDGTSGTTNPQNTSVGSFTSLGGIGAGHAEINGGTGLELRGDNEMPWGRYNATSSRSAAPSSTATTPPACAGTSAASASSTRSPSS